MFFDSAQALVRVLVIAALAYGGVVVILRVAGKRVLAKLNAFDLVVTVALGSTLATVLLSKDVALLEGLLAFVMLAFLQGVVARLSIGSPWFRSVVRSEPRLLVDQGRYLEEAMKAERITKAEVDASIRGTGLGRIEDVDAVVLETDGSLSVLRHGEASPTLLGDVKR